ncbi:lysophospholipid acyltransferase family protein [Mycolicibacterium sp. XJ662]
MAGVNDVLEWAKHQVTSRVPKADLDQRDPDYIREQLPGLWLVASLYFRADVRGLDRIPAEGPVLLVGNHSGGNVPPDTFVFTLAFCSYFGVERPFYQLAHNLVVSAPPLASLRKFGTVAANHENAQLALKSGGALLVYPGGDYEVFRPSWERNRVDFGGRKGYVRLAREAGVPIVPVASVGGQESVLFLSRGQWLARLLRVDKMFRLKSVPIAIAPPWGLVISDLAGHIPLPAKITVEVQEPIGVEEVRGGDDDVVHDKVISSLQAGVDALAAERRFPVIG